MGDGKRCVSCRSCGSELPAVSSVPLTGFCPTCLGKKQQAEAAQRDRSIQWFRQRAEQGDGRAQYVLGQMYASGEFLPKDEIQAHVWIHLAALNGHREAMVTEDVVARRSSGEEIAEAKCLARTWLKKTPEEENHD